jgi:HD superfamily phosphohydrolase
VINRDAVVEEFKERINKFAESWLSSYYPKENVGKFIHDSVWGTNFFEKWEVALIDSPLLQRLRDIHQTGFAFFLYPTALHTRFDHTLGVISIVDRIVDSLNKNNEEKGIKKIESEERYMLRLAALLHDIGHGPFSHVSEEVYGALPEFSHLQKWFTQKFNVDPKPHEILSYMIASSEYFVNWFDTRIRKVKELMPHALALKLDLLKIAGFIVGYSQDNQKKYLADIINGPIDIDKLDYLARDAKFAGLSIGYDVYRYFKTVNLGRITDESNNPFVRLTIPLSGINAIEQMLIGKIMLTSSIYHHHKIRCAEAMFKKLCKLIIEGKIQQNGFLKLKHPTDFLDYVDSDFFNHFIINSSFTEEARYLAQRILERDLMKRALIISPPFIEGFLDEKSKTGIGFKRLKDDCENNGRDLQNKIASEVNATKKTGEKIRPDDIIIDVPKQLIMKESLKTIITETETRTAKRVELVDIFPLLAWVANYNRMKWRIHIFCYPEVQESVNKASRKILLNAPYKIDVLEPASTLCKLPHCSLD